MMGSLRVWRAAFLAVGLLALVGCPVAAQDEVSAGIVVWRLEKKEGVTEHNIDSLSGFLTTQVQAYSGVRVISDADILTILRGEETRQQCGVGDTLCMVEIGAALGVPETVSGDLGKVGSFWMLNLRRINVRTAEVIARSSRNIRGSIDDVIEAIPGAVAELFDGPRPRMAVPLQASSAAAAEKRQSSRPTVSKGYAAIPGEVESLKRRNAEMEKAWKNLMSAIYEPKVPAERRVMLLERFLQDFEDIDTHHAEAKRHIRTLKEGHEPGKGHGRYVTPERLRTKPEWFAVRATAGNYGGGVFVSMFTVRWRYFFWEIARGGFGTGGPGCENCTEGGWGVGGMMWGFPWHIDPEGRHELRFGVGLEGGPIWVGYECEEGEDCGKINIGPNVSPEICYVWHQSEYFALQTGIELRIPTIALEPEYGDPALPPPVFNVFFGFRI